MSCIEPINYQIVFGSNRGDSPYAVNCPYLHKQKKPIKAYLTRVSPSKRHDEGSCGNQVFGINRY